MSSIYLKMIKSVGYAAAAGALTIGTAKVDLIDADPSTMLYMVVAAVVFNLIKELAKKKTG